MPYFPTTQVWLEQSQLLLAARPTTTRITTKYTVSPPFNHKKTLTSETTEPTQPQPPKAFLTLKTYDPVSGACLKYKTDKAAEVGRLVAALGTCGRVMAALSEKIQEAETVEGAENGIQITDEKATRPLPKDAKPGQSHGKGGATGGSGGGGGGKKKKGKR